MKKRKGAPTRARSAKTGRITTKADAAAHPSSTVVETVPRDTQRLDWLQAALHRHGAAYLGDYTIIFHQPTLGTLRDVIDAAIAKGLLLLLAAVTLASCSQLTGVKPAAKACTRTYDDTIHVRFDSLPDHVVFGRCKEDRP